MPQEISPIQPSVNKPIEDEIKWQDVTKELGIAKLPEGVSDVKVEVNFKKGYVKLTKEFDSKISGEYELKISYKKDGKPQELVVHDLKTSLKTDLVSSVVTFQTKLSEIKKEVFENVIPKILESEAFKKGELTPENVQEIVKDTTTQQTQKTTTSFWDTFKEYIPTEKVKETLKKSPVAMRKSLREMKTKVKRSSQHALSTLRASVVLPKEKDDVRNWDNRKFMEIFSDPDKSKDVIHNIEGAVTVQKLTDDDGVILGIAKVTKLSLKAKNDTTMRVEIPKGLVDAANQYKIHELLTHKPKTGLAPPPLNVIDIDVEIQGEEINVRGVVLPYCNLVPKKQFEEFAKNINLNLNSKVIFNRQPLRGLATLHEENIAHRDIKKDNIYYNRLSNGKIEVQIFDYETTFFHNEIYIKDAKGNFKLDNDGKKIINEKKLHSCEIGPRSPSLNSKQDLYILEERRKQAQPIKERLNLLGGLEKTKEELKIAKEEKDDEKIKDLEKKSAEQEDLVNQLREIYEKFSEDDLNADVFSFGTFLFQDLAETETFPYETSFGMQVISENGFNEKLLRDKKCPEPMIQLIKDMCASPEKRISADEAIRRYDQICMDSLLDEIHQTSEPNKVTEHFENYGQILLEQSLREPNLNRRALYISNELDKLTEVFQNHPLSDKPKIVKLFNQIKMDVLNTLLNEPPQKPTSE